MVRRRLLLTACGAAGSWARWEKVPSRSRTPGLGAAEEPPPPPAAVTASAGPGQGLQQLHSTPKPSEVPQRPLTLTDVFGETEAWRRGMMNWLNRCSKAEAEPGTGVGRPPILVSRSLAGRRAKERSCRLPAGLGFQGFSNSGQEPQHYPHSSQRPSNQPNASAGVFWGGYGGCHPLNAAGQLNTPSPRQREAKISPSRAGSP